jgi:putative endonuclease
VIWARYFYRYLDRSLSEPVDLAARRQAMGAGEWNRFFGDLGERLAVKALRRGGLKVLYRNFRAPKGGEVDIVCREGEWLVFVEVKTRSSTDFGRPVRAVDEAKQVLIVRGGLAWLRELNHPDVNFRFDVVEVVLEEGKPPQIEHLRNVFQMPESYRY